MPSRIVMMNPPGSRPGMRNLATIPTISPKMIQPSTPIPSSLHAPYGRDAPAPRRPTSLRHLCPLRRRLIGGHGPYADGATDATVGRVHDDERGGHGLGKVQGRFHRPPATPGVEPH